jgi:hypothetical protein
MKETIETLAILFGIQQWPVIVFFLGFVFLGWNQLKQHQTLITDYKAASADYKASLVSMNKESAQLIGQCSKVIEENTKIIQCAAEQMEACRLRQQMRDGNERRK